MKNISTTNLFVSSARTFVLFVWVSISFSVSAQIIPGQPMGPACLHCEHIKIRHFQQIPGHSAFGSKDLLRERCSWEDYLFPVIRVVNDGKKASVIELDYINTAGLCTVKTLPEVEFVDEYLEPISSPTPEEYGEIEVTTASATKMYFNYTHPTDPPEDGKPFRIFYVGISMEGNGGGGREFKAAFQVAVFRTPVVMIHGLWSDKSAFDDMAQRFQGSGYQPSQIYQVDYQPTHGRYFATNASKPPEGIISVIDQCKDLEISAGAADLVVHSMGGNLSRLYLQGAYQSFENDVRRLITCNTPHSGGHPPDFLLDTAIGVANDLACQALDAAGMNCYQGAIADLRTQSNAIFNLNQGVHPNDVQVHGLITVENPPPPAAVAAGLHLISGSKFVAIVSYFLTQCGVNSLGILFNGDDNDLNVAALSQAGGLSGQPTTVIANQMHMGSVANEQVMTEVIDLLAEPANSSRFTNSGYSPPYLPYNNNFSCIGPPPPAPQMRAFATPVTLEILSPTLNDSIRINDSVEVVIASTGLDSVLFAYRYRLDSFMLQYFDVDSATLSIKIPKSSSDTTYLTAIGMLNGQIELVTPQLKLPVYPEANLTGIEILPNIIYMTTSDTVPFSVVGQFDDGMDRDLTDDPETKYLFLQNNVLINAMNELELHEYLNDTLIVTNDGFKDTLFIYAGILDESVEWIGNAGLWTDAHNWSTGVVPGPNNKVLIEGPLLCNFFGDSCGQVTIPEFLTINIRSLEIMGKNHVTNYGTINIRNSDIYALTNRGGLSNYGTILVENIHNEGLTVWGTSSDPATMYNNGTIIVQNGDTSHTAFGVNQAVESEFINDTNGIIQVKDAGFVDAITQSHHQVTFQNYGEILVDGGGISGSGTYYNNGLINIDHTTPAVYGGYSASRLYNDTAGVLQISDVWNTGIRQTNALDTLKNYGTIDISNITGQGLGRGIDVENGFNYGLIQLSDIIDEGIYIHGVDASFLNGPAGEILIEQTDLGIYIWHGLLENAGTIEVDH